MCVEVPRPPQVVQGLFEKRFRDTKLDRDVALKVLPQAFTDDPDRLARFEREAKVLASLNHPNIGGIHGLEESDGIRALVLEYIEGPMLADRIAQGPIPVDEALPIAKQIAEALEAAHEAGVIHRDLKPANIKVREDGMVKVLDFGLAKALDTTPEGDPSQSPTLTAAATQIGVIMGTAAYMSPEQAKARPVDKRSDVWAFGAVLYEMLTGQRAFAGSDVSEVLASILAREPDWMLLPRNVSLVVGTYLRRCLNKDPKQRIGDVQDVRLALEGHLIQAPRVRRLPPNPQVFARGSVRRWCWRSLFLPRSPAGSSPLPSSPAAHRHLTSSFVWPLRFRPDSTLPQTTTFACSTSVPTGDTSPG